MAKKRSKQRSSRSLVGMMLSSKARMPTPQLEVAPVETLCSWALSMGVGYRWRPDEWLRSSWITWWRRLSNQVRQNTNAECCLVHRTAPHRSVPESRALRQSYLLTQLRLVCCDSAISRQRQNFRNCTRRLQCVFEQRVCKANCAALSTVNEINYNSD